MAKEGLSILMFLLAGQLHLFYEGACRHFMHLFIFSVSCSTEPFINYVSLKRFSFYNLPETAMG